MAFRDLPEHERARHWRETMKLSRAELSAMTGYSESSIKQMETGKNSAGDPVGDDAWQRYRLICAAVMAGLDFDWRRVKCGDITIRADEWKG
jgi:transcriptional regulator with XRE-family HTH domain